MNFNFLLDHESEEFFAVSEVLKELNVKADDPEGLAVETAACEKGVRIVGDGKAAKLYYANRTALIRGVALLLRYAPKQEAYDVSEEAAFELLGTMVDSSRNAVLKPENVKKFCRITALAGFNMLQLYTEDTYEVKGEPYFGHLRGRFSAEELKDIDAYAAKLGIEVIPCIQTLAHLNAIFKWEAYRDLTDCEDILNAADPRIYDLIEKFIANMSENLKSRKINIGMDEAYMLGRGKYRDIMGPKDSSEVMLEHLKKVVAICKKYGYKPEMWSDMFFRMCTPSQTYYDPVCNVTEEIKAIVPPEITLVYWDYYGSDKSKYDRMFENHLKFNNPVAFAGGSSTWYGAVPLNVFSLNSARAAMSSAREHGAKEIYVTMWGDNGGQCSQFSALPTLVCYGENNWNGRSDDENIREAMLAETGVDFDSLLNVEQIQNVGERKFFGETAKNPSRWMLYQDLLQGKLDAHVPEGANAHFAACRDRLIQEKEAGKAGQFAYLYDTWIALCDVLSVKAEAGKQLKAAYDANDREALANMRDIVIPEILDRVDTLHQVFRTQWMKENKPFGFDVQDIRMGGLKARLTEACVMIDEYLDGTIDRIEELEAPRLIAEHNDEERDDPYMLLWYSWGQMVTANVI